MNGKTNGNGFEFNYGQISAGVATLDAVTLAAQMATADAGEQSESDGIERVLTIYMGVRPLLVTLSRIPLIPVSWRNALTVFIQALEAVATLRGFKAGKDL